MLLQPDWSAYSLAETQRSGQPDGGWGLRLRVYVLRRHQVILQGNLLKSQIQVQRSGEQTEWHTFWVNV